MTPSPPTLPKDALSKDAVPKDAGAAPDISVILCTYNRCDLLQEALKALLAQQSDGARYEVLVVDNRSTDRTRQVCEEMLAQSTAPTRYLFEPQQGVSYARNTAIRSARAPILAFSDDDVCVRADWVAGIKRAFDAHPQVVGIGGRVLPKWRAAPPRWLTRRHWTPLALQDYGDEPLVIDSRNPLCLVAANLALRRAVFDELGLFSPALQRVKDGIGSMEDLELHMRLWAAGHQEMYVPDVVATATVQTERLTQTYHRRWYRGNGRFYAQLRAAEFEQSAARLFDVPAHLYRQACGDVWRWGAHRLRGNEEEALLCEARLAFFAGFFGERRRMFRRSQHRGQLRDLFAFLRSLARPKKNGGADF